MFDMLNAIAALFKTVSHIHKKYDKGYGLTMEKKRHTHAICTHAKLSSVHVHTGVHLWCITSSLQVKRRHNQTTRRHTDTHTRVHTCTQTTFLALLRALLVRILRKEDYVHIK
jgi:hypothetical protein